MSGGPAPWSARAGLVRLAGRGRGVLLGLAAALALVGCASPQPPAAPSVGGDMAFLAGQARIVDAGVSLQCVAYARQRTNIGILGDAWTWWDAAAGRYRRGQVPEPGAVLVLRRNGRSLGHLAVITGVVDERTVIASHANWLNRGRIHENTPIRDVSPEGDWSAVRVWYTPGGVWGRSIYPAYGFIYDRPYGVAALPAPPPPGT